MSFFIAFSYIVSAERVAALLLRIYGGAKNQRPIRPAKYIIPLTIARLQAFFQYILKIFVAFRLEAPFCGKPFCESKRVPVHAALLSTAGVNILTYLGKNFATKQ